MTFYLKYRPQTIDELDLEVIRDQLKAILASGRLPHAFLFSGPKGLGKTSAARILAKAINCEKIKNIEPCNKCEACVSITRGTALDLIEIDAASNRGIDDIRALREKIRLAPSQLKYKVYIIDEVHMLTPEAFNALLKTLEEPPEHAIFILATTELQKLPETIISRCLQLKFKKPTRQEALRSLKRVVEAEKLETEEAVLELIVRQVAGSFRDAVKTLEQLSFGGKKISLEKAEKFFNQDSQFNLTEWLSLLLSRESSACLQKLQQAVNDGVDLRWLISQALEKLRHLLLCQHGVEEPENEAEEEWLAGIKASQKEIISLAEALDEAGRQLRDAVIPQLPLELAVMEWSSASALEASPPAGGSPRDASADKEKQVRSSKYKVQSTISPISPITPINRKPLKTKLEDIEKNWEKILQALRPHNSSIEALLRSARPLKLEENFLTIEAFYPFHKERLENGKCSLIIEKVISEIFGEEIKIKCILGKKRAVKKEDIDVLKDAEEIFM